MTPNTAAKRKRSLGNQAINVSKRNKPTNATQYPLASFLGLPRELRDQIYHEIWRHKASFHVMYKKMAFKVLYENRFSPPNILKATSKSPWFLISKQVLNEAIEQFHRKSLWTYDRNYEEYVPLFDRTHKNPQPLHQPSRLLLSPWKAFALDLGDAALTEHYELASHGKHAVSTVEYIGFPYKHLDPRSIEAPTIRRLRLSITLYLSRFAISKDKIIHVNFGPLEQLYLPSLQSVDILVSWINESDRADILKHRIREQVVELGLGIIG